jgi:hypothetical protein
VSLKGVVVVKFADAMARVLERIEIWTGGGATFGAGVTAPFVASPPAVRSRVPTSLSRGGHNRRIVAAVSIPQGIRSSSYWFTHWRGKTNKEHGQKKIIVRRSTGWKMLFQLPHENAGLETLHFHGEAQQLKIGLPLALSKLSK